MALVHKDAERLQDEAKSQQCDAKLGFEGNSWIVPLILLLGPVFLFAIALLFAGVKFLFGYLFGSDRAEFVFYYGQDPQDRLSFQVFDAEYAFLSRIFNEIGLRVLSSTS